MDPIRNTKDQKKAPVAPPQAPQRTASPIKNQNLGKSPVRPPVTSKIVQPIKPQINSPPRAPTITSSGKTYTPIQDISTILDQNPSKRQNVVFLKSLLDSQLQALQGNLKLMQSDNSEIETETIQRLQLIQKFGNDASNGLAQAKAENSKLIKDLSEQKQQHKEVMNDQTHQQSQIKVQLADLEKSLKMLRTDLESKQQAHKTAMLSK